MKTRIGEMEKRLIEEALNWPDGPQPDRLAETVGFIRRVVEKTAAQHLKGIEQPHRLLGCDQPGRSCPVSHRGLIGSRLKTRHFPDPRAMICPVRVMAESVSSRKNTSSQAAGLLLRTGDTATALKSGGMVSTSENPARSNRFSHPVFNRGHQCNRTRNMGKQEEGGQI